MARKKNTSGGGSNTTRNGLSFEQAVDILPILKKEKFRYNPETGEVKYKGTVVGYLLYRAQIYKWLRERGINYKNVNSKRFTPDITFINEVTSEVNIFEVKYQTRSGSVDEKIKNGPSNKKCYQRLFVPLGYSVNYRYVLNSWFKEHDHYQTLNEVVDGGCGYSFEAIPKESLKLNLIKALA